MRQLLTLTKDSLLNAFRTKKAIIFLVLYLGTFGAITFGFIKVQEHLNQEIERQIERVLEEQGVPTIGRTVASSMGREMAEGFAREMLRTQNNEVINFLLDIPFLNLALFGVTIFGTPLLILILKYDLVAQENYEGTMRFLLFRTSRTKIILAKFISSIIEIAVLTFIALVVALIWANFKLESFDFAQSLRVGVRFWAIAQVFLSAFVAFALLISVIFKKPFVALTMCFIGMLILILLPIWTNSVSPLDIYYLRGLFYGPSFELMFSLFSYGLFSLGILTIANYIFNKKNL
jgi:ABC-type transport system involved in multi-copper enzyme maturation permease subunit